jgi:hypothetical protein
MKKLLPLLLGILMVCGASAQSFDENAVSAYITPDFAPARSLGTWRVVIKPNIALQPGTNIKVLFMRGFRDLQRTFSSANGFVRVSTSASGANASITDIQSSFDELFPAWEFNVTNRVISVRITNAAVQPGDSIVVSVGDGGGSSRSRAHETACSEEIEIAIQQGGSGDFLVMNEKPVLTIRPLEAAGVYLINTAGLRTGEQGKLLITSADIHFNVADSFTGTVEISGPPASVATYPGTVTITAADSGKKEIPIVFHQEGVYKFTGRVSGSNIPVFNGNPIWVCDTLGAGLYFGDIHSHGAASRDAVGRDRYKYARYARGLDFFSSSDHADHGRTVFGIRADRWMEQMLEVLQYHQPGVFVPFMGLENSYNQPSGHYTVLFSFKDEDIFDIPNWPRTQYPTIQSLWQAADDQGFRILTNPHHSGKIFNSNLEGSGCVNCNTFGGNFVNREKKRMVEVYSQHGQSELYNPNSNLAYETRGNLFRSANGPFYAQNAWALGERLGTIAGTDNHTGHPGSNPEGIAAVWTDGLNRDSVFQALYDRSFYGTTGERIILHFSVNNQRQGQEILLKPWDLPQLHVFSVGTDELEYAEILKWDFKRGTYSGIHPNFQILGRFFPNDIQKDRILIDFIDTGFSDSCMYYVRVKQKGFVQLIDKDKEIWAWSSPIWVSHESVDLNGIEDSLINYLLVPQIRTVQHFWKVIGETNAVSYELYKLKDGDSILIQTTPASGGDYSFLESFPSRRLNTYFIRTILGDDNYKDSEPKSIWLRLDSISDWDAALQSGLVALKWNGWNELYTDYYYVERSLNGGPFETIDGRAPFPFNDQPARAYLLFDQPSSPGEYTYRIRQVLSGDETVYSDEIKLSIWATNLAENSGLNSRISLGYNLLKRGQPLLIKNSGEASQGRLQIFDINGQVLHDERYNMASGAQQQLMLNFRAAGMYYILMRNAQNEIFVAPFVVQ